MSYFEAIIFGIVQGITEFLPISSTAHIIITGYLLGLEFPGLSFEIFLHQASVLAVMFYFRRELFRLVVGFVRYLQLRRPADRVHFFFGLYIVVATAITGVLGYALQKAFVEEMKSPAVIGTALIATGAFLIFIERVRRYGDIDEGSMRFRHSILVGLGQTLAVIPGISRSGATLVAALWCGLNRETAVRYSFLLAIPVIVGSSVLAVGDLRGEMTGDLGIGPLAVAFVASFLFSVLGIVWLIDFLKKSRLIYFAGYCFLLGLFVFFFIDPETVRELP
jgi:undecaprenyl-diphosphatase